MENVSPRIDSLDIPSIDSAEQDLPDQQVLGEIHSLGTPMNRTVQPRATESNLNAVLDRQGNDNEAYIALLDNSHSPQMDYLALTHFRPVQYNDMDLDHLYIDQGRRDTLLEYQTNVLEEINGENIRLRIQRDDLLGQRAALENDLSTSFMEKLDLEKRLLRAKTMIEKGKAYYNRLDAEWKGDFAKLQHMTRLFEANTENARYVEVLRQQNILEEENSWLFGQLQMKTEDNRLFACQREAALQASSYERACTMSSEIRQLRQWLSTVQAQLADIAKAKKKVEEELQQERLEHQAIRNACHQNRSEFKHVMGSCPYNARQTVYAGRSAPQKPSKFTPSTAYQAQLPKAGAPPPFTSRRKCESNLGADTFFEPFSASGSTPQQYGTRSKSKFSFGDNNIPQSATTTEAPTGAVPRTDFNFSFGGIVDHQSSPNADGNITDSDLPKNSTSQKGKCPANIAVGSSCSAGSKQTSSAPSLGNRRMPSVDAETPQTLDEHDHGEDDNVQDLPSGGSGSVSNVSAEVRDKVDPLGGLSPKMTTENTVSCNSTGAADLYVDQKTQARAQKPLASDFFNDVSVKAEAKMYSMDALVAEKTSEEKIPIAFAGTDVVQQTHTGGSVAHSATAKSSVQAGNDNEATEAVQSINSLLPPPTIESTPPASKGSQKWPKNKGRTQKRAFLRKIAKARKKAEIGGAGGEGTS